MCGFGAWLIRARHGSRPAGAVAVSSPIGPMTRSFTSAAPGQLAVRCAGKLVGALERGVLIDALTDVFDSDWLPALFAREREEIRAEHAARQAKTAVPTQVDPTLVGRVSQHMLRRAIQLVRGTRHGGMILLVDGARGRGGHSPQVSFRRGRALAAIPNVALPHPRACGGRHVEGVRRMAGLRAGRQCEPRTPGTGGLRVEPVGRQSGRHGRRGRSRQALRPARVWRRGVRGATRPRPRLARSRHRRHSTRPDELESVGTRHRAAYRFVHERPGGLAIVISQDGGVSFVANRAGDVMFWEQSVSP